MMYKSFSMTQFMTHMYRSGPKFVGVYAVRLGISLSIMGALAIQMKEISRGREPRKMDLAFLGASIAQGGGLGIFGDFISASGVGNKSRFGNSVMATAMGPGASLVEDVVGLGVSGLYSYLSPLFHIFLCQYQLPLCRLKVDLIMLCLLLNVLGYEM